MKRKNETEFVIVKFTCPDNCTREEKGVFEREFEIIEGSNDGENFFFKNTSCLGCKVEKLRIKIPGKPTSDDEGVVYRGQGT